MKYKGEQSGRKLWKMSPESKFRFVDSVGTYKISYPCGDIIFPRNIRHANPPIKDLHKMPWQKCLKTSSFGFIQKNSLAVGLSIIFFI